MGSATGARVMRAKGGRNIQQPRPRRVYSKATEFPLVPFPIRHIIIMLPPSLQFRWRRHGVDSLFGQGGPSGPFLANCHPVLVTSLVLCGRLGFNTARTYTLIYSTEGGSRRIYGRIGDAPTDCNTRMGWPLSRNVRSLFDSRST